MGEIDYATIFDYIGQMIKYAMPISIAIGLIERVVRMVVRAATGKAGD